jgi:hypothetical protein
MNYRYPWHGGTDAREHLEEMQRRHDNGEPVFVECISGPHLQSIGRVVEFSWHESRFATMHRALNSVTVIFSDDLEDLNRKYWNAEKVLFIPDATEPKWVTKKDRITPEFKDAMGHVFTKDDLLAVSTYNVIKVARMVSVTPRGTMTVREIVTGQDLKIQAPPPGSDQYSAVLTIDAKLRERMMMLKLTRP